MISKQILLKLPDIGCNKDLCIEFLRRTDRRKWRCLLGALFSVIFIFVFPKVILSLTIICLFWSHFFCSLDNSLRSFFSTFSCKLCLQMVLPYFAAPTDKRERKEDNILQAEQNNKSWEGCAPTAERSNVCYCYFRYWTDRNPLRVTGMFLTEEIPAVTGSTYC